MGFLYNNISQYAFWHIVAPLSCIFSVVNIFAHKRALLVNNICYFGVTRNANEQAAPFTVRHFLLECGDFAQVRNNCSMLIT